MQSLQMSIEKFLKGVTEFGKIKDDSSAGNGLYGVPKTKDPKKTQPEAEVKTKMSSGDSPGRQKSPRKPTLSPRQPLSSEELNVR